MLIYEKKVEGVRHLFGTLGNVPSESDKQLTYTDEDGDVVTDLTVLSQLLDDGHGGIKTKTGGKILVWLDDLNIIPGNKEDSFIDIFITSDPAFTKMVYNQGDALDISGLEVSGHTSSGDVEVVPSTDIVTNPENGAILTQASGQSKIIVRTTNGLFVSDADNPKVVVRYITGLVADTSEMAMTYGVGDTLDVEKLGVKATFGGFDAGTGERELTADDYTVSPTSLTEAGTVTITVSGRAGTMYEYQSTTFDVTVS